MKDDPGHQWAALRSAVLVGTERRPVPAKVAGMALDDRSPEERALTAAALLGAARRAGLRASVVGAHGTSRTTDSPPAEPEAPAAAVQLLELLLAGNIGRGSDVQPLLLTWFAHAGERASVVPHHLLVAVLDRASSDHALAAAVRPALGARGRWLAARRDSWAWAHDAGEETGAAIAHEDLEDPARLHAALDRLRARPPAARLAALRSVRRADASRGRTLVAQLWVGADATARAELVEVLAEGVGDPDEPLLEAALDDRSKTVRAGSIALLEQLPRAARAARCASALAPLVERTGMLRPSLEVRYPDAPEGAARRDLGPDAGGAITIEAAWLRTLVAGTPLGWWHEHLGSRADTPDKVLGLRSNATDDLLVGWTRAAIAQRDLAWATALLARVASPELAALAGAHIDPDALVQLLSTTPRHTASQVLVALPHPWPPAHAEAIVRWLRSLDKPGILVGNLVATLATALDPAQQPLVDVWLARTSPDDTATQQALRRVALILSTRRSLREAFA